MFGALFYLVAAHPEMLERSANGFLKTKVEEKVLALYPALDTGQAPEALAKLSTRLGAAENDLSARIADGLPELIAVEIAKICGCADVDEAQHRKVADFAKIVLEGQVARFGLARERLSKVIKGEYGVIFAALRADVLIFLATNLTAFSAILLVSLLPIRKRPLLILPCVALISVVAVCSYAYLFSTNWFFAVLFDDYWGYGYAVLLACLCALVLDIVANRGRITEFIFGLLPSPFRIVC